MKHFWIAAFLLFAGVAQAQNLSTSGKITVQATGCSGAGAGYVYYQLPPNASSVALTLSGTWSGTMQFVASTNDVTWSAITAVPMAGGAAVTSATANGTWSIFPGGAAWFCIYAGTYNSGTVTASMSANTAVASVSAAGIQAALGFTPAANGANNDITSLSALSSPVPAPGFYLNTLAAGPVAAYFDDFFATAAVIAGLLNGGGAESCNGSSTYEDQNHPGNFTAVSGTAGSATGVYCVAGNTAGRPIITPNSSLGWIWSSAVYVAVLPGTTAAAYQAGMVGTPAVSPWTTGVGWYLSSANGGLASVTGISGGGGFSGSGTLLLTSFNGCTGATATVTIASGAFVSAAVTAAGSDCAAAPTSATCTSGTATCTGSPVSITVATTVTPINDWYCEYGSTYVDSGTAATVAWTRLGMVNDGTHLHWYVNGTEAAGCEVAIASVPSATAFLAWTSVGLSATTNMSMGVDYVYFQRSVVR